VAAAPDSPWSAGAGGLIVTVRLTPKGGRDAIEGIECLADGRRVLKARVRAAASDGAANAALIRLMAQAVAIAPREISFIGGATSRIKRLLIRGDVRAALLALERIGGAGGADDGSAD
jgi:uncharacterized protein YggU (UPF0235/DUF167 family)